MPPPARPGAAGRTSRRGGAPVLALVLSLLWLGGVGSLAAVLLARRAGAVRGRGLRVGGPWPARAGLVLGYVGIVVTAGLALGVYNDSDLGAVATATEVTVLGRPLDVTPGDSTGTSTVTVSAVTGFRVGTGPAQGRRRRLVVAAATVCNLSGRPLRRIDEFFRLRLSDGREVSELIGARVDHRPDLSVEVGRPGRSCLTGDLTFRVPGGERSRPVRVLYQPSPAYAYAWRIPG